MELIEKIEVYRGPSSSLYGIEAYLGVANIVTRKQVPNNEVVVLGGSRGTKELSLVGGGDIGKTGVAYGVEAVQTNGIEPYVETDGQSLLDQEFGTDASLAPGRGRFGEKIFSAYGTATNDDTVLSVNVNQVDDKELGVGSLPILDDQGKLNVTSVNIGLQQTFYRSDEMTVEAALNAERRDWSNEDVQFYPEGAFGGLFPEGVVSSIEHTETFLAARVAGVYTGLKNHTITQALNLQRAAIEVTSREANYGVTSLGVITPDPTVQAPLDSETRHIVSGRINDDIRLTRSLLFSAGVSGESQEGFHTQFSPRAALVWNVDPRVTLKALVGQAVRFPAFLETVTIAPPALQANDEAKPEKVTSYDLAAAYQPTPGSTFRVNLFHHDTRDLLSFRLNSANGALQSFNVGDRSGEGIELEYSVRASDQLEWSVHGLYQEDDGLIDFDPNDVRPFYGVSPRLKGGIRASYQTDRFTLGASYTYTGGRIRQPDDPRPDPDTYDMVDVSTSYQFSPNARASLKIENLLDEQAFEQNISPQSPFDIELPRRGLFASFGYIW